MSKILLLSFVFNVGFTIGAPALSSYRYLSGDTEVRRSNHSEPITFKGIPIGTAELSNVADPGTVHSLSEGHHFYQRGWYLSDVDGGAWQFLPNRKNATSRTIIKRQAKTLGIDIGTTNSVIAIIPGGDSGGEVLIPRTTVSTITKGFIDSATTASWDVAGEAAAALDFFDGASFVTSSTSLIGDISSIFFNALELFA